MIELIKYQAHKFYIKIHGIECVFMPMCLFVPYQFLPLDAKVKQSTLGWYVNRKWVSYHQIKKVIKQWKQQNN